jgi:hypothetical protein
VIEETCKNVSRSHSVPNNGKLFVHSSDIFIELEEDKNSSREDLLPS